MNGDGGGSGGNGGGGVRNRVRGKKERDEEIDRDEACREQAIDGEIKAKWNLSLVSVCFSPFYPAIFFLSSL